MEKQENYSRHYSVLTTEQISDYIEIPTKYIEVEGVNYAYRSLGEPSGVPIICLQHFIGTLDNWDPIIMNGLAREREVITINNTGIGGSGGETPDNVQAMSQDAIKIISALSITKCDILGFSLGGFIAQTLADIKPDLIRKIILVGTAPQTSKSLVHFPQLAGKALAMDPVERFLFIFATESEKSRAKIRATLNRLLSRTQDRDKEISKSAIQAQISALTRWGTDPATISLSKISHPVLIIQGSDDEMMDSGTSLDLYRQIPNSVLTYYPDSAHGSFFQYPELFVDQANFFLNSFE
jgi:Predicted hydrolases or acyltransferases (alpha/beta hydrolase superfamily)